MSLCARTHYFTRYKNIVINIFINATLCFHISSKFHWWRFTFILLSLNIFISILDIHLNRLKLMACLIWTQRRFLLFSFVRTFNGTLLVFILNYSIFLIVKWNFNILILFWWRFIFLYSRIIILIFKFFFIFINRIIVERFNLFFILIIIV
jgi:hypothetical protein